MIFKLNIEYTDIEDVIDRLSENFDILFNSQSFYISEKKSNTTDKKFIRKILSNYENLYIVEINENNLKYENVHVQCWCRDKFVSQDLQRYEEDNQDKIQNMLKIIEDWKNNLEKIAQRKEGENGRREKEERKTSKDTSRKHQ